jgi:prepilin-type N-terminal cleavage/methylation domain-containing protein
MHRPGKAKRGFTLIELSIVLVIIGLIVGGVLVGRDLIKAAEVRATVSQIERYNTAVNTFRGKYNALPGDLNAFTATQFGFTPRGTQAGQGDGNGVLEEYTGSTNSGLAQGGGETGLFWVDLSTANGQNVNLIDGSFSTATANVPGSAITAANMGLYFPPAKLGGGNVFTVGSATGQNSFVISVVSGIDTSGTATASPGMTVQQAYGIDKKIDDGLPLTGWARAVYITAGAIAAASNGVSPSATTCFDTTSSQYSVSQSNGAGVNCTLSVVFQ